MLKAHLVTLHGVSALSLAGLSLAPAIAAEMSRAMPAMQQGQRAEAAPVSRAVATPVVVAAPPIIQASWSPATKPAAPAVPMPGAQWLFGSALVAFVGIAARRSF